MLGGTKSNKMTETSSSTNSGLQTRLLLEAASPELDSSVSILTSSVPISVQQQISTFLTVHNNGTSSRRGSNILSSSIPERSENEEDVDRIEAELDEMARYIGPVAKSLFTPVVAPLIDANSFADALGVSPLYKQKETQRWSSALQTYRQMSSQEPNGGSNFQQPQTPRWSEDDELAQLCSSVNNGGVDHIVGDFDENLMSNLRPSAPTPRDVYAAPIAIPAPITRQQQKQNTPSAASSVKSVLSPSFTPRLGFMTPPASSLWISQHQSLSINPANYVVSPPRRQSSGVSPGEASLNSLELEAIAAVHELQFAVKDIYVSEMLPRTSELIFLNVTTLEGQAYCVELTMKGWRVTSLRHDCMNGDMNRLDLHIQYFETIYALMDRISPDYRKRFTDALMTKLTAIQAERGDEGEKISTTTNNKNNGNMENGHNENDRFEQEQRQTFT